MTLGEKMAFMRTRKGIRQYELAQMLNLTRSAYAYYETGKTEPSIKSLQKLSAFYGFTIDEFIKGVNL